ncbi:MAG: DUF4167 domain-containing protein, partial [Alphaproteobacteria bacterium]|nr:DUF4167 domain-containing protein [Alphaproteobacteria bacterium]
MRPNNANNRRSRGRGGRKSGNTRNQSFDSNGPGARVRGNASQIYEKYQQLARDAASGGDRVGAENFLQHAEHYYRLMIVNGPKPEKRNDAEASQQEFDDTDGLDSGGEAEAEVVMPAVSNESTDDVSGSASSDADSLPASLKPSGNVARSNGRRRRPRKTEDADQD